MQRLLQNMLKLAGTSNNSRRITLCLIISTSIAGALLISDSSYLHSFIELILILQITILASLYFSTRTFLQQSKNQLTEINLRNRTVTTLNNRIISLINSMTQIAVITTDSQERILLFSSGAEKLFGINQKEALGKNYEEVVRTKQKAKSRKTIQTRNIAR